MALQRTSKDPYRAAGEAAMACHAQTCLAMIKSRLWQKRCRKSSVMAMVCALALVLDGAYAVRSSPTQPGKM